MLNTNRMENQNSFIGQVPDDIFLSVFKFLDTISLMKASRVCRRWYRISQDKSLTKSFDLKSCSLLLPDLWRVLYKKLNDNTATLHIHGKLDRSRNMEKLSEAYLTKLFIRCKNLTNLSLEHFDLRHIRIELLSSPVLCTLSLNESMLSMDWFDKLKDGSYFPSLKVLKLNNCNKISNNDLTALSYLHGLETLHLNQCYRISARGIPTVVANLKLLNNVDFSGIPGINNVAMYHLSTLHLKRLSLRFCHLITDAGVENLLKETGNVRKSLEFLDLFSCHEISNNSLLTISCSAALLKFLDVGACQKVTSDKVEKFRKDFPLCLVNYKHIMNEKNHRF